MFSQQRIARCSERAICQRPLTSTERMERRVRVEGASRELSDCLLQPRVTASTQWVTAGESCLSRKHSCCALQVISSAHDRVAGVADFQPAPSIGRLLTGRWTSSWRDVEKPSRQ